MKRLGLMILCIAGLPLPAGEPASPEVQVDTEAMISRAVEFLRARQQTDGSYSRETGPGVTALITTSLLRHGRSPSDPLVARSLKYLEYFVQPSGGIHAVDSLYRNYETCLAILCFSEANQDGRYDEIIRRANAFASSIQWGASGDLDRSDPSYGGSGYGTHKRPDLSNTSFLMEALRTAGESPDSEAIQRALIFVSRCQNLESPHNTTAFSTKVGDGGFYYTIAAGGSSQAGETANGGLRSYGSMTYAGLKSMLYAGVGPDDPRVQAAVEWIRRHYDVANNPGMGDAGLFYYYHTFAKALSVFGEDSFVDDQGEIHDWRADLAAELARRQRPDGSWSNSNERWLEKNPDLSTGYALLTLSYLRPGARL